MVEHDFMEFKDTLAKAVHGMTAAEAQAKGVCIDCKQEAASKCHSTEGRAEYKISAMCEECFDTLFTEEEY